MDRVVIFACYPDAVAHARTLGVVCKNVGTWLQIVSDSERLFVEILDRMQNRDLYLEGLLCLLEHPLYNLFIGMSRDETHRFMDTLDSSVYRENQFDGEFVHVLLRGNKYIGRAYSRITGSRLSVGDIRESLAFTINKLARREHEINVTEQLVISAQAFARQLDLKGISVTEPLENAAKVALLLGFGRKQSESYDDSRVLTLYDGV